MRHWSAVNPAIRLPATCTVDVVASDTAAWATAGMHTLVQVRAVTIAPAIAPVAQRPNAVFLLMFSNSSASAVWRDDPAVSLHSNRSRLLAGGSVALG